MTPCQPLTARTDDLHRILYIALFKTPSGTAKPVHPFLSDEHTHRAASVAENAAAAETDEVNILSLHIFDTEKLLLLLLLLIILLKTTVTITLEQGRLKALRRRKTPHGS